MPRNVTKPQPFFDIEAEASDDEEDEEDDEYGGGRKHHHHHGKDEQMDAEAMEIIRQQDRRRAQAGARLTQMSVAEISREIEQRHRMQRTTVNRNVYDQLDRRRPPPPAAPSAGGGGGASRPAGGSGRLGGAAPDRDRMGGIGGSRLSATAAEDDVSMGGGGRGGMMDDMGVGSEVYTAVAQQSLVPSVSDPSLWMVSCAGGKEQELVYQIMNKCIAFARQGRPLGISAAIAAQSKGKVYIESFSEPAVMEAIQGVRGLLQYTMKLVPIGDMTTVMTVTSKKKPVKKNEWVRMTRGHYKGDLALVKAVKESGLKCIVQCVPRLDFTLSDLPPEEARVRRRTVRPPQ